MKTWNKGRGNFEIRIYKPILLLIILFYSQSFAQNTGTELKKKVSENAKLFQENLDAAYGQFDGLLKEAKINSDSLSELIILDRKCRYFYSKNLLDSLIQEAGILQLKAKKYKDNYSQAMGNMYLAEAYSINGIHEKALKNLAIAYEILQNDKTENPKIFFAKANVLNSYANVYTDKGEPREAVKKLLEVIKSYNTLENPEDVKRFQYLNYSNVANLYLQYDLDSAEYFAKKSIELKPKNEDDDKIMMMNFYVLGVISKKEKRLDDALSYFRKSIDISEKSGVELNANEVYTELVEIFKNKGQNDSVLFYESKLKELEINILQSKYNSLQKVIDKEEIEENNSKSKNTWIYVLGGIILVAIGLLFYIIRRKKTQIEPSITSSESYNNLLELLEKNDPAFMFSFEQVFPDFSDKLLSKNPQLSKSEIEFCALLKMNISTKEIAKYTFIEPRTVQNKKYRIRKRLNIPSDADIYNWFDSCL